MHCFDTTQRLFCFWKCSYVYCASHLILASLHFLSNHFFFYASSSQDDIWVWQHPESVRHFRLTRRSWKYKYSHFLPLSGHTKVKIWPYTSMLSTNTAIMKFGILCLISPFSNTVLIGSVAEPSDRKGQEMIHLWWCFTADEVPIRAQQLEISVTVCKQKEALEVVKNDEWWNVKC